MLRDQVNYQEDVETNDISSTGVRKNCELNSIDDFHVTSNDIVDVMHDFAEGVADYGMSEIINYYITNGVLSLQFINDSIKYFDFGRRPNKPPPIKCQNIEKKSLGLSASEMINLVFFFAIMFGMHVPQSCEVWKYYLILYDIQNILMLKSISLEIIDNLQYLIETHHILYLKLFKTHIKPKHHHLLHYPRLMKMVGPLCHLWSMRFEGKNLECKFISQSCRSRINLCKSIAERHMLQLSSSLYFLRHTSNITIHQEVGPSITHTINHKWVKYKNVKYYLNDYVALVEFDDMPQFAKISAINCREGNVQLELSRIINIGYNEHMRSYEVSSEVIGKLNLALDSVSEPLKLYYVHEVNFIPNIGI